MKVRLWEATTCRSSSKGRPCFSCEIHRHRSVWLGYFGGPVLYICKAVHRKLFNETALTLMMMMTKGAMWQSFIFHSSITHWQERNSSYVSQLQLVGRECVSFVLLLGWIAQQQNAESHPCFFLRLRQRIILSSKMDIKRYVISKVCKLLGMGCKQLCRDSVVHHGIHGTWHVWQRTVIHIEPQ